MPDFEDGLEATTRPPYVLLPGFLVQLALCGQLVLIRRLVFDATVGATSEASAPGPMM